MPYRGYRCFDSVILLFLSLSVVWGGKAFAFGFDDVDERAKQLAAAPFNRPSGSLPRELQGISYDQYRDIRYRRSRFLWSRAKLPFEVAFFHQGWLYDQPVKINEIADDAAREVKFDPEAFEYGSNKIEPAKLRELGFAGFRVHYPLNTPRFKDEVLVFLGASYLRALGKSQLYGLSARGLAIDTAVAAGEEFPRFTEFWIEKPAAKAEELTIYALLDSRRVAGAYRFVLQPGAETVLEVKARLYLRDKVGKLGVAPLTSMFSFGENQRAQREDYRPEVHDSDGLALHAGNGEWLWRPLVNPRRPLLSSFATTNPQGFGLMQRDRDFSHYEDLDARYELRPSAWIEPKGKWGAGRVELVQLPAPDESSDNIVAYWVPENSPSPKEPYDFEYRVRWQKDAETRPPHAWVAQTRRGHGFLRKGDTSIALLVDFSGPALRKLGRNAKVEAVASADANAQIIEREVYRHDVTGGWRMTLRVRRLDEGKPVELRAFLRSGNQTVSETWSYLLPPN
ncbi:MAG TPA: glucan biosynthesis protein G [Burkholderiales bacterium]|nr:glucan biosynthesis protein G [Burkholderiales bacterium]